MKLGTRIVDIKEIVKDDVLELWGLRQRTTDFFVLDIQELKYAIVIWVQDCYDKEFVAVGIKYTDTATDFITWTNWQMRQAITLSDKVRLAVFS